MESKHQIIISKESASQTIHYISMLGFGWFYSLAINILILKKPFTFYSITESLGSGFFLLLIGSVFIFWIGPRAGWCAVLLFAFLTFYEFSSK